MATRQKTIRYAHSPLASLANNTLGTMTQITVYIPESSVSFQSVMAVVSADQTATGTGNISTRQLQCRLGAAGYTAHTNSSVLTGSGEDIFIFHAVDLTSHFTSNWSGTSMTFDSQVLMNGTAASAAWTNISVELYITYDYDDTSTTQIKTVYIPLDMPVTNLATTKPGTALATIPNLSTLLPESSKVFRGSYITVQGNVNRASTTDLTMTFQLDATTSHTTGVFEGVSNTDYFMKYVWDAPTLNTASSMGWYAWANSTDFNHLQAWLTVTYQYDASTSSGVFVSTIIPMELASPMGGTTSADYQRASREFWVEEPGTITTQQVAFYVFWDQAGAIAGLNMRIGTGSFVTYTDIAAVLGGNNAAMVRNDSAFTLARGRNALNYDVYRTDATDLGMNVSGFWIVNYTADTPSQGYGAENHTVFRNMGAYFNGAAAAYRLLAANSQTIPESDYFLNAVGVNYQYITNATGSAAGVALTAERLATGEGGLEWESIYADVSYTDPEVGLRQCWAQARSFFKRFPSDADPSRVDVTTARRWRAVLPNNCASFDYLDMVVTYHTIAYSVTDSVSGFSGTVSLGLHRSDANSSQTGELVKTASRSGDGSFTLTWYDNTEAMYITASDGTNVGRSQDTLAS